MRDAERAVRSWPSVLVGLGIPALALLGGIVVLSGSGARVLGWPVLYLWVFLCFPLTTVCLAVSWRVFDRPHYAESGSQSDDAESGREFGSAQERKSARGTESPS